MHELGKIRIERGGCGDGELAGREWRSGVRVLCVRGGCSAETRVQEWGGGFGIQELQGSRCVWMGGWVCGAHDTGAGRGEGCESRWVRRGLKSGSSFNPFPAPGNATALSIAMIFGFHASFKPRCPSTTVRRPPDVRGCNTPHEWGCNKRNTAWLGG